jgi:hypothetical protein
MFHDKWAASVDALVSVAVGKVLPSDDFEIEWRRDPDDHGVPERQPKPALEFDGSQHIRGLRRVYR